MISSCGNGQHLHADSSLAQVKPRFPPAIDASFLFLQRRTPTCGQNTVNCNQGDQHREVHIYSLPNKPVDSLDKESRLRSACTKSTLKQGQIPSKHDITAPCFYLPAHH